MDKILDIVKDANHPSFLNLAWAIIYPAYRIRGIRGILSGSQNDWIDLPTIIRDGSDPRSCVFRNILYILATDGRTARTADRVVALLKKRIIWDVEYTDSVNDAHNLYDELCQSGWQAYYVGIGGRSCRRMCSFDPNAEEMVFVPKQERKKRGFYRIPDGAEYHG
jgi:hypothetical protein